MLACVQAYNDFVIDWIAPAPKRFIPVAAMPFWDLPASAREVERVAAMGHKAILFSGAPHEHGQPFWRTRSGTRSGRRRRRRGYRSASTPAAAI